MNARPSTWPIWTGFLLTLVAFFSFPFFFARFPVTRDFPWVNFILFAIAFALLVLGVRRAFAGDRRGPKIAAVTLAGLSTMAVVLFVFGYFVMGRQLPASKGAPQAGQKAPEFTLPDQNGKATSLAELLSSKDQRAVLLVFYRGYW